MRASHPSMLVNAKAFEDEVGGLIFTSGLLEYAAQEQEHCEFPVCLQLLSTYEQARYNLFPYRLTGSQAWPLEWLATTDGDQIKLDNLALPALGPGSNEDHPLRQYAASEAYGPP